MFLVHTRLDSSRREPLSQIQAPLYPTGSCTANRREVNRVLAIEKTRVFASFMRYSCMAIQDACTLRRSALVGNLITSKRTKTDRPFRVRIPIWLADELRALPPVNSEYFFWNKSKMTAGSQAKRCAALLSATFKEANVEMTSHYFRHYFISYNHTGSGREC